MCGILFIHGLRAHVYQLTLCREHIQSQIGPADQTAQPSPPHHPHTHTLPSPPHIVSRSHQQSLYHLWTVAHLKDGVQGGAGPEAVSCRQNVNELCKGCLSYPLKISCTVQQQIG